MKKKSFSAVVGGIELILGCAGIIYMALTVWSEVSTRALFIGVCALFALCGAYRLWRGKPLLKFQNKYLRLAFRSAAVTVAALALLTQALILGGMLNQNNDAADMVILLGAKIFENGSASPMLSKRIDKAYEFLVGNEGAVAVLCGGVPAGYTISEAEVMRNYLVSMGISEDRLYLDADSKNTIDSVKKAAQIAGDIGAKTAKVISSDYHLYRSVRYAKNAGFDAKGLGSATEYYVRPIAHFRESLSIMRDFLFAMLGIEGY